MAAKSHRKTYAARHSRTRSERRAIRLNFLRKSLSLILLLLSAFPMFGGGVQPLCVIPAVMCIALREDLYFTMGSAVLAGICIDLACGNVLGANAILLVCWCTFSVLLFEQLLRRSFLHFIWLTAAGTLLQAALYYLLTAALFRVPGREILWTTVLRRSVLYTVLAAPLIFLLFLPLKRMAGRKRVTMPHTPDEVLQAKRPESA